MNKLLPLSYTLIILSLNASYCHAEAATKTDCQCSSKNTPLVQNNAVDAKPTLKEIAKKGLEGLDNKINNKPAAAEKSFKEADALAKKRLANQAKKAPSSKPVTKPGKKQTPAKSPAQKKLFDKMKNSFFQGLGAKLDGNKALSQKKFDESQKSAKQYLESK